MGMKTWKVDYALRCEDQTTENSFVVEAGSIMEALKAAEAQITEAVKDYPGVRWTIWNIGIVEDELF